MLAKLGYKPGAALGKTEDASTEPIHVAMKEDRGGIGLDAERKRKLRQEVERVAKKVKEDEISYRDRVRTEREEKRREGQIYGAQKIAERFDTEEEEEEHSAMADTAEESPTAAELKKRKATAPTPLKGINLLWRGLARDRVEKDRDKRMRHDLQQSLSRLPEVDDSDSDDADDFDSPSASRDRAAIAEEELDEDDGELDEFKALPSEQRLEKLVLYLRDKYWYCFWCKYRYPDAELDGCPGITEEDHD
jgi:hypothetical protein